MNKGLAKSAAIVLPIIVVLMIESCSRTLVTLRQDLKPPVVDTSGVPGAPSRELGWEGFRVPDPAHIADDGLPRIVAIGDSNTWGYGVQAESAWPEVLNRALPNATVVNMGTLGYSSFQGYQTLRKYGEALAPAAIIASFNYNDRAYVYDRRIDSEEKFATYYDASKQPVRYDWIDKIYTTRLLRAVMRRIGLIRTEPIAPIDVRDLEARVPLDEYRQNLRKIAEYGRSRNVPVMFILLKDNPYYTRKIEAGIDYGARGDHERAIRAFTIGLSNRISGIIARRYLAHAYAAIGDGDTAARVAHVDRQRETVGGLHPIYLDSDYNRAMIEVADELGVEVVDARPVLDANPQMFLDMCHPDEVGHKLIAALVLEGLRDVAPALADGASEIDTENATPGRSATRLNVVASRSSMQVGSMGR
jgi:lysophospholipase L1-like esterase